MFRTLFIALALLAPAAAQAAPRPNLIYSYEPANVETRRAVGQAGLTFEFRKRLVFVEVLRILSTAGAATAPMKPARESDLGTPLVSLIGVDAAERDLFEVDDQAQGGDLIRAFCPGSTRAWMAFGRVAYNRDLRIHVIGDTPGGGPAHRCRTLDFHFKGEWRLPRQTPSPAAPPASPMPHVTF